MNIAAALTTALGAILGAILGVTLERIREMTLTAILEVRTAQVTQEIHELRRKNILRINSIF